MSVLIVLMLVLCQLCGLIIHCSGKWQYMSVTCIVRLQVKDILCVLHLKVLLQVLIRICFFISAT